MPRSRRCWDRTGARSPNAAGTIPSLLADDDGTLYVGIERVHQIVKFDYAKNGLLARAQAVPRPAGFAKLPSNRGMECLAAAPKQSRSPAR